MQKQEFIERINALGNPTRFEDLDQNDYETIEYVYMYHPAISSKDDIAKIFCLNGGFHIITDMVKTAEYWEQREKKMRELQSQIAELTDELNKIYDERRFVAEY
jgi:mitochondrial fission protein ELM1